MLQKVLKKKVKKMVLAVKYQLSLYTDKNKMSVSDATGILENVYVNNRDNRQSLKQLRERNAQRDLSVIVPVYNGEKYISECIEDLLLQKTQYQYEIIIVDDGSVDGTKTILNEKYSSAENIKLIFQENAGAAAARNRGLIEADGTYVMFVDADDRVEASLIEDLLKSAYETDSDITGCGYYCFQDGRKERESHVDYAFQTQGNNLDYLKKQEGYVWGKAYKREIWEEIRFPEGFLYEDMILQMIVWRKCRKFMYIPKPLYGYRNNLSGVTNTSGGSVKSFDQFYLVQYLMCYAQKMGVPKDQEFYVQILKELGPFLYGRVKRFPELEQRAVFYLSAALIEETFQEKFKVENCYKKLEKAFYEKNFKSWKYASEMLF